MATTDPLAKVKPGQPLRIPASAYNAFVDAAKAVRNIQQRTSSQPDRAQGQTLVVVKNTTGAAIPRFGIIGIDGVLFQPGTAPEAFKQRPALVGSTPAQLAHTGKFVITLEPIAPGKLGMACASGLCIVKIDIPTDGRERIYADVADGVVGNLMAADHGAATILWHEAGSGVKWAVVRVGASIESRKFPVALTKTGGSDGTAVTPATWLYDVDDAITGESLAQAISPVAPPHAWRRPAAGPVGIATFGIAHADLDDTLVLDWCNETAEPTWSFPLTLTQTGGTGGSAAAPATWTYTIADAKSGLVLGTNVDPVAPPNEWRRPPRGKVTPATHGYATLNASSALVIGWINELPDIAAASVFPITLVIAEIINGTATTPTNHQYDVFDAITGLQLNTPSVFVNPGASPHQWKRPSIGRYAPATFGLAYTDATGAFIITWTNETPELEACA